MLLSIVTGTVDRLDFLRAAVESVRLQMFVGLDYEIIVVDGGSHDGTEKWCLEQSDIRFIQQETKLGAIRAFDAGCEIARGDYLLLLNDDVLMVNESIIKALIHLETHPMCGAVAVMDNRRAPGYDTDAFKVQTIRAIGANGKPKDVVYAQVGLYRMWIARECGFWGSKDNVWGEFHTYGGDARLSAMIWEMGYTVDAVPGVAIIDRVAPDDLRRLNASKEEQIGSAYYRRYPNGVQLGRIANRAAGRERLRILYLPLFSPGFGRYKRGLFDALAAYGWVYELDYVRLRSQFVNAARQFQPHIILTQFHDAHTVTPDVLHAAREQAPGAVVVNWMGDFYPDQLTAPDMLELLKHVDLQLTVNTDVFPTYEARGISYAFWQIGFEPVSDVLPEMPSFNVLFQGNAYSPARRALGAVLRMIDPSAGLYGFGWDELGKNGQTFYNFDESAALYRNCKIAIGDSQWDGHGFVSNRFFEATANGAFLLHQTIPGMEELTGFVDGVHYVSWRDHADLREKIVYYLNHEDERKSIALAGEKFARQAHSFDARVKQLFQEFLPKLEEKEYNTSNENVPAQV